MMELILWRHAEAVDQGRAGSDLERALTAKGERQAERMAAWLTHRLADATEILVSPALRCQQTAQALGRPFRTVADLAPGTRAETLLRAARWPDAEGAVLVVGHQPTLGLAAALALTGTAQPWSIKKGAAWWLRHRARDEDPVVLLAVQSPESL